MPETVFYTSSSGDPVARTLNNASRTLTTQSLKSTSQTLVSAPSSGASSVFSITPGMRSEENLGVVCMTGKEGCGGSSLPVDEGVAERKNERRYRILLSHHFHSSCGLSFFHQKKTNFLLYVDC